MSNFLNSPFLLISLSILLLTLIAIYIINIVKIVKNKTLSLEEKIKKNIIKIIILIVVIFLSVNIFNRTIKYFTFDRFLIEDGKDIRYTTANLDAVWESYLGKYYSIRKYTGGFSFYIDNNRYEALHEVPEDFTNYNYFIKINIAKTNYSEIISVKYKIPNGFIIPSSGFTNNPLPMLSNFILENDNE